MNPGFGAELGMSMCFATPAMLNEPLQNRTYANRTREREAQCQKARDELPPGCVHPSTI
jgi:hypothetical protein